MKILFLTDNFYPEVNAPANRTYEHCREWVAAGQEVTVLTGVPNFPNGKVFEGYRNKLYQQEYIDGIRVIRVWTYITANKGYTRRIADYFSYAVMAFWSALFVKTDLIIVTSPQFFTAISGFMLAFIKRKKWIFEVRDLWPESIIAVKAMKRNALIKIFEWIEKRLYLQADLIVVVTNSFKDKIVERGIDANKIQVFKNGVDLSFFKPDKKDNELIKSLGIEGRFVIGYIGTLGMAHGLDFILDAIKDLNRTCPEIVFIFIGDGAEKDNLIEQAEELALENCVFHDSVGKNEVIKYLNLLDVALVNLRKAETFKTVIPSKIFEAAAMRKPILLGLNGETKGLVMSYNAGICYEPEDRSSFLMGVEKIHQKNNGLKELQQGCDKLAADFNRKEIAIGYLRSLQHVAGESNVKA